MPPFCKIAVIQLYVKVSFYLLHLSKLASSISKHRKGKTKPRAKKIEPHVFQILQYRL